MARASTIPNIVAGGNGHQDLLHTTHCGWNFPKPQYVVGDFKTPHIVACPLKCHNVAYGKELIGT